MNIRATVFHYPTNEIDISGVVLHKEYFSHRGTPSSSLRVLITLKAPWTEGEKNGQKEPEVATKPVGRLGLWCPLVVPGKTPYAQGLQYFDGGVSHTVVEDPTQE